MNPGDELALLESFHRDKLAILRRHEAAARAVRQYDINNTYQYIIGREQAHVSWLQDAIAGGGGRLDQPPSVPEPSAKDAAAILEEDVRLMREFVARWREPVEQVGNARHKGMLRVILGEALEHMRFFQQAAAGRLDLLGRRTDGAVRRGEVLSTRWASKD